LSLDFVLIKSYGHPLAIEDIAEDATFKNDDYRRLAERLFGPVTRTGGVAIAVRDEMSFELTPNDGSLSVTARGPGDTVAFMEDVAVRASKEGIVTVELQGSEILLPFSD
jgi:hypothetical protein